jgi:(2Fe-2S) ferredoxin/2-polyprenyl-3-methyl-5-hydroxy-6-metoxy-1,4-benzoquinol methylase
MDNPMEPFRYHVYVCDQKKPEGVRGCAASGSGEIIEALNSEIAKRGLIDAVFVTTCGSLGLCESGPNMVVYPEGIWYSGVTVKDIPALVQSQFVDDIPLERLARTDTASLRAEMLANRKRMLAAAKSKNASGALPDDLTQRIRGFQESRVLLTAIELDVFSAVQSGGTVNEVSGKLETNARATEMLLNVLVSMGLLSKENGIFRNTPVSARYFVSGSPDDARAAFMHTVHLWDRWSTLSECVRRGTAVDSRETSERGDRWTTAFIAAMHRNAIERAPEVVQSVGAEGIARMLDVGGGSGAYSIAFARANDGLHAEILDVPAVVQIAQSYVEQAGLSARIKTRVGDLRTDSFGKGFDLVFVSAICHMLSFEENEDLIGRCYKAIAPNGRLVVQEFFLEKDKTSPLMAALFSLNMLVGTKAGSSYSIEECAGWLKRAGFQDMRHIRLPGPTGLMTGTKLI